jgi:hypothetical protein
MFYVYSDDFLPEDCKSKVIMARETSRELENVGRVLVQRWMLLLKHILAIFR